MNACHQHIFSTDSILFGIIIGGIWVNQSRYFPHSLARFDNITRKQRNMH